MKSLVILIFLFPVLISAQELNAKVTLNYEQLQTASKERLESFAETVEGYLNNNRFTGSEWEGEPIDCSFMIFFSSAPDETSYSAQLIINSTRPIYGTDRSSLMLNLRDEKWSFKYEKNQGLYFNQADFNPLTSMLDFYAYIIIGFDMDSYEELGGAPFFQKALDIAVLGASTAYSDGWQVASSSYSRRGLVDDLLAAKFQQFRIDFFNYHYNGIDIYFKYKDRAQQNIVKLVNDLAAMKDQLNARSVLMKVFFDAKAGEFVEYLKDYPDKEIWKSLRRIDPPHSAKYDEILYKD